MVLGTFLPACLAILAVVEIFIFRRLRNGLPSRMEAGFDETTPQKARALTLVMWASALAPVLLWVILNLLTPEIGDIEIF